MPRIASRSRTSSPARARSAPARQVVVQSRRFDPAAPLRDFVRLYRFLKISATRQAAARPVIARSGMVLVFNLAHPNPEAVDRVTPRRTVLPEILLVGAQTMRRTDIVMTTGWTSFSVHFKPGGFYRLFGLPVHPFTNRVLDAREILDGNVDGLYQQLRRTTTLPAMHRAVEAYLLERVADAMAPHPVARAALKIQDSHGSLPLARALQNAGIGVRQFQRCFIEQIGMPPKVFARVARLNFVLEQKALNPSLSWTDIAIEAGYFDYKHLVRDFKAIAGTSPTAYLASPRRLDDGFLLSRDGKVRAHF